MFEALNQHFSTFNAEHAREIEAVANIRQQARQYIGELQGFLREHSSLLLSVIAAQTFAAGALDGNTDIESLEAYFKRGAALMRKRVRGKPRVAPDLLVRVSFAAVLGCVMFREWVCPPRVADDAEINDAIIDFIIEGINVNSDPGLLED